MAVLLTEWQTKMAVKWRGNGLAIEEIAAILGRGFDVVRDALQVAGVEKSTRRAKQPGLAGEYRDGYDAGYRSALCHAHLYGLEAAHEYSRHVLLPWARNGDGDVPPAFPGMYGNHD